jgi:general secretion pathway protein E/type IV pilus assembly protein PilB
MNIAHIFTKHGLLDATQLAAVQQQAGDLRLDRYLIDRGLVSEERVLQAFAREFGLRYVDLTAIDVDRDLLARFPTREIFRHMVFPIERRNGTVVVATSDPFDLESLDELSAIAGGTIEPVLARRDELGRLIKSALGVAGGTIGDMVAQTADAGPAEAADEAGAAAELAQQSSVVKLVNELLGDALEQRASDVHLEPDEHGLIIRYRVDGLLRVEPVAREINQFRAAIISRLKIMARLNIAEKRLPQDGRIHFRFQGRDIDVRVSVIPMLHGEGIVLRLLDKSRMVFDLKLVNLPARLDAVFRQLIRRPHGIILVTGPTGSGKTTTLYAALAEIKSPATKIITIEDPVEYHLPGICQIQTHAQIGLSFAAGLRSILRHDPDIILIGEIRDAETAHSAIQAALTGHLVFSTLHTNDSCSAFTRLTDMGVEPYLVSSTVEGVLAQRLVRRLCPHCKREHRPADADWPGDFPPPRPDRVWQAAGCRECHSSGYAGRVAIFELLRTDARIRQLCIERASAKQIREHALRQDLTTLRQSGWELVAQGTTSVDEILRVCSNEE